MASESPSISPSVSPSPSPTDDCPDPLAPDFLRCLKAWELKALDPFVPYIVFFRAIADDGTYDSDALELAVRKYRYKRKPPKKVEEVENED
jgi:hypothetical protein